jgi:hypothetical protein
MYQFKELADDICGLLGIEPPPMPQKSCCDEYYDLLEWVREMDKKKKAKGKNFCILY